MTHRKRFLATIATLATAAAATVAFAAPSDAAPYVQAPVLSISISDPCKGTSQLVEGTGFVPGSALSLTLHSRVISLGSVVVSPAGGFSKTIKIPNVVGTRRLVAAGPPTPKNPNTAEVTVHIRDCSGPIPITGYSGNPAGGGTGYAWPAGLAALAGLILGGVMAWRRRSRKHAA